ncbi:MAG: hypothetical protein K0V04_29905 [Deltaproteobacteria bacterium]|nr:hypothetical protein [Deltaproteobacteria bacterium]
MPGSLNDKDKKKIQDAFEKAALDAGYKMKVRADFGDELRFSDFAKDMGSNLVINSVLELATHELRRRGIKLKLGDGGSIGDWMPDRYALVVGDKRVYGAVTWEF